MHSSTGARRLETNPRPFHELQDCAGRQARFQSHEIAIFIVHCFFSTISLVMVICATPGCGTPGRPLAACDMCQGRLYCGSHCLIPIQPRLLQQIIRGNENHVNAEERLSQNVIDRLRACSKICPPCYSNFSIFVSPDFAEDDKNEEEN